jgi:SLOG in TRPM, prokaryote
MGQPAIAVRDLHGGLERIGPILDALGVRRGRPVLVVVGGASGMSDTEITAIEKVMAAGVLPLLADRDAVVVDGGTDSGIMRAVGRAGAASGGRVPLIGVAVGAKVARPGESPSDKPPLEPHHTHAILVDGDEWGDESPWLAGVADAVAEGSPSVTLVVNGGKITYHDAQHSLDRGRPVVVVRGTGRAADAIAGARDGAESDPAARRIGTSALTSAVELAGIVDGIRSALEPAED